MLQKTNFNDKMHKNNKYFSNPPKFDHLAKIYPNFSKFVYKNKFGGYSINWKDKMALKELNKALLDYDFDIHYWDIPDGFLIPSIPSRCNYIHWISDLIAPFCIENVQGMDIGTGANLIYPILGHQIYGWSFIGTDINNESLQVSQKIIRENNLETSIQVKLQPSEDKIFENIVDEKDFFHFCMSNPPYFSIEDEIKQDNPHTDFDYNEKEAYCSGGEFGFICKIIKESHKYKNNFIWFTTLVGRKFNLDKIENILKEIKGLKEIKKTTFYQGKQARWGIAWTFNKISNKNDFEWLDIITSKVRFKHKKKTSFNTYHNSSRFMNCEF
jgi:23S rRNA (adenine1618-N6)-methyltransferase